MWLLDLQAVSKTGSLAEAAYSAVVLRDRCAHRLFGGPQSWLLLSTHIMRLCQL